jgi:formamidopyrimidine-DNA glycosylase
MDQETLAGLGNVYSDEVLYHARIRPGRPVSDIPEKERRKLFRAMKKVLSKCEEVGGDARKLPKRSYLIRHRDDDAQCPRCGGALQTGKVGGRTARFCPTCQE